MPVSPARSLAFEILLRVEREESYAAELLHSERLAKLSSRDHGLATELVMGVLRWQSLLDQRYTNCSFSPEFRHMRLSSKAWNWSRLRENARQLRS